MCLCHPGESWEGGRGCPVVCVMGNPLNVKSSCGPGGVSVGSLPRAQVAFPSVQGCLGPPLKEGRAFRAPLPFFLAVPTAFFPAFLTGLVFLASLFYMTFFFLNLCPFLPRGLSLWEAQAHGWPQRQSGPSGFHSGHPYGCLPACTGALLLISPGRREG